MSDAYRSFLVARAGEALKALHDQPRNRALQIDAAWELKNIAEWCGDDYEIAGPVGDVVRRFRHG